MLSIKSPLNLMVQSHRCLLVDAVSAQLLLEDGWRCLGCLPAREAIRFQQGYEAAIAEVRRCKDDALFY